MIFLIFEFKLCRKSSKTFFEFVASQCRETKQYFPHISASLSIKFLNDFSLFKENSINILWLFHGLALGSECCYAKHSVCSMDDDELSSILIYFSNLTCRLNINFQLD